MLLPSHLLFQACLRGVNACNSRGVGLHCLSLFVNHCPANLLCVQFKPQTFVCSEMAARFCNQANQHPTAAGVLSHMWQAAPKANKTLPSGDHLRRNIKSFLSRYCCWTN